MLIFDSILTTFWRVLFLEAAVGDVEIGSSLILNHHKQI
jgi:hypothetical protein